MQTQVAESRSATMPLLAFNRKDTGWRIDWQIRPLGRRFSHPNPVTLSVWRYRDRRRYYQNAQWRSGFCYHAFSSREPGPPRLKTLRSGSRNRGQTGPLLHALVIGAAAALRRNPGDIAVRVLDVAGLAVDAVLGVDLEARASALLDPFVNAGRAIAVRRTGIDVVLR